ncbi:hypothetical protein CLOM_g9080 [Closterium sp. NIES-68]|nr:hypothetical protein CLOM_g9080 [Closterium sp. NIES-68]
MATASGGRGVWEPGVVGEMPCSFALNVFPEGFSIDVPTQAGGGPVRTCRVILRPTSESIAKDVAAMADASWSYQDMLEVEARILRAVQPPLCLDPSPRVAEVARQHHFHKTKLNAVPPTSLHRGLLKYRRLGHFHAWDPLAQYRRAVAGDAVEEEEDEEEEEKEDEKGANCKDQVS